MAKKCKNLKDHPFNFSALLLTRDKVVNQYGKVSLKEIEVDSDEIEEDVEGYKSNEGGEDESDDNYASKNESDDSINELQALGLFIFFVSFIRLY